MTKQMKQSRDFGYLLSIVLLYLFFLDATYKFIFLSLGVACVLLTYFCPNIFKPLAFLWLKFGDLLNKITSPIFMAIIFFCVFTPFNIVLRLIGKTILPVKFDKKLESYWTKRQNNNNYNMTKQF